MCLMFQPLTLWTNKSLARAFKSSAVEEPRKRARPTRWARGATSDAVVAGAPGVESRGRGGLDPSARRHCRDCVRPATHLERLG